MGTGGRPRLTKADLREGEGIGLLGDLLRERERMEVKGVALVSEGFVRLIGGNGRGADGGGESEGRKGNFLNDSAFFGISGSSVYIE